MARRASVARRWWRHARTYEFNASVAHHGLHCTSAFFACTYACLPPVAQNEQLVVFLFPPKTQDGDEEVTVVFLPPPPTTFDHDSRVPDSSPGEANKERNIGSPVAHHGQLVAFWFC